MKLKKTLAAAMLGFCALSFSGCGDNSEEVQKLVDKGIKQHNAGSEVEAINTFNAAIKLDPENVEAWANVGNVYNALGNYDKAIEALNKAVDLNPNNGYAWICLGSSYNSKGDYDKAIECFERAQKIGNLSNELQSSTLAGLGVAYANKDDAERGLEFLNKATELNPKNEYAWENIEIVKKKLDKK